MRELKLKYSESHPLKANLQNEQFLSQQEFILKFEQFPWIELLEKLLNSHSKNVQCSPSLNLEDSNQKVISVSIVGELNDYEFYVCYKRPILRKRRKWYWFSEQEYLDKDFCSIIPQQSKQDAYDAFMLFYERNFEELEKRW